MVPKAVSPTSQIFFSGQWACKYIAGKDSKKVTTMEIPEETASTSRFSPPKVCALTVKRMMTRDKNNQIYSCQTMMLLFSVFSIFLLLLYMRPGHMLHQKWFSRHFLPAHAPQGVAQPPPGKRRKRGPEGNAKQTFSTQIN